MSLTPAFEIGLWNAWILMLYLPLHPLIMMLIDKTIGTGEMSQKMEFPAYNKTEKILALTTHVFIMPVVALYSIFLPLKLSTAWLYVGLPICFLGGILMLLAYISIIGIPAQHFILL